MSQIRFLYKSQFVVNEEIVKGSKLPVTSGAVFDAIDGIRTNTVFHSGYIANCIATVEKQHEISFSEDGLKIHKGSKVYVPAGKKADTGEFLFDQVELTDNIIGTSNGVNSYNTFLCVDTTDYEWVGGFERTQIFDIDSQEYQNIAKQGMYVQEGTPKTTTNGTIWWDLTNNLMREYIAVQGEWVPKKYSIPVCKVSKESGTFTGILQDFLTCGACGFAVWVNPGVTFVMSEGRADNGTYEVLSMTTDSVVVKVLEDAIEGYSDYCFYITPSDEIIGPVAELSHSTSEGYFFDEEGNKITCARFAYASAKHLTTQVGDPLTITSFIPKDCLTIADSDDVEFLIKMIGSTSGDTIDSLNAKIAELEKKHDDDMSNMKDYVDDTNQTAVDNINDAGVHNKGDETIEGVKTFTETIIGNISGNSETVTKIDTSIKELMPLGVEPAKDDDGNPLPNNGKEPIYVDTTVRIGANYVKADEFRGISTHTRWADLAEIYATDKNYPVGTLVKWGGEKELTLADSVHVNAVISENPAHLMNSEMEGQPIALVGRVRVRVKGTCKKHDYVYAFEPGVAAAVNPEKVKYNQTVFGRALEDKDTEGEGLVLCFVQINFF